MNTCSIGTFSAREEESHTVTIRQDVHDCKLGPLHEDNARALTVETLDAEALKE